MCCKSHSPSSSIVTVAAAITATTAATLLILATTGEIQAQKDKVVILTFDDNWKSQYTVAKPILDKYGFNATYFIYCSGVGKSGTVVNWNDLKEIHKAGYDIQSHSMTHADLTKVNAHDLDFEVSMSKECLQEMIPGLNVSIFATPYASGRDNTTIIKAIQSAGYDLARIGYGNVTYLGCDGWYVREFAESPDCSLYTPEKKLKFANRYNLPAFDVNSLARGSNQDINKTYSAFIHAVDTNQIYNGSDALSGVPILVYHNLAENIGGKTGYSLLSQVFGMQMKYLHDNGYRVISMRDLAYDNTADRFVLPK